MTDETPLLLPRKLVLRILHEAQIAQPEAIHGWIFEREGLPQVYRPAAQAMHTHRGDESLWARLWSKPDEAAVPQPGELRDGLINLIVSLNTKGVLEIRAWELHESLARERSLSIID